VREGAGEKTGADGVFPAPSLTFAARIWAEGRAVTLNRPSPPARRASSIGTMLCQCAAVLVLAMLLEAFVLRKKR
jgi:hypothetical protein